MSAIPSQAINRMTLLDLYSSLDWSGTEEAAEHWQEDHPEQTNQPDKEFTTQWRQTLLLYALPQEITGSQCPDWSMERNQSAKAALAAAGVWPQVVDWLVRNDLIGPVEADDSAQLPLFQE
jgi:hypothetical protein